VQGEFALETPEAANPVAGPASAAPADAVPPLRLEGIVKRWPGAPAPVLDNVALRVEPGTVVEISGRNGAGKTTLLRIAASLILPDAGTVRIGDLDPERDRTEYQRRIGFVAAGNSGLFARLKVEHHLSYWARLALLPRARRDEAIAATIEAFQLGELCGKRVDRLSMGQRQRLRLSLAFLHGPQLVMLDEPRTSLDDEAAKLLEGAVRGLTARGGAALVCAPSGESEWIRYDRRYVVADGRLEERAGR
jgi:ABC-2 type transport system ATP-binding protein